MSKEKMDETVIVMRNVADPSPVAAPSPSSSSSSSAKQVINMLFVPPYCLQQLK